MGYAEKVRETGFFIAANDIFEMNISTYAKLVYVYLAKCSNNNGVSFPSLNKIAEKCNCSRATVARAINELIEHDLVDKENQYAETDSGKWKKASNIYTLNVPSLTERCISQRDDTMHHTEMHLVSQIDINKTNRTRHNNIKSIESKKDDLEEKDFKEKEPKEKDQSNSSYEEFFNECWSMYPNKKGKGKITRAKKINAYKLGDEFKRCIQRYLKELKDKQVDKQFIQHGSTFWTSGYVDYLDENTEKPKNDPGNKPIKRTFKPIESYGAAGGLEAMSQHQGYASW